MKRPHLFFRNPVEGIVISKIRRPNPNSDKNNEIPIDIEDNQEQISRLREYKEQLVNDRKDRILKRNKELNIPTHIEYLELEFWGVFDINTFERKYFSVWGLQSIRYYEFNYKSLFAIVDNQKFEKFFEDLDNYINSQEEQVTYNPNIRFIKGMSFLTSQRMIQFIEPREIIHLDLIENLNLYVKLDEIKNSLADYLEQNEIESIIDNELSFIELYDIDSSSLIEIINNFDIIHTVSSPLSGIIRPNEFNLPNRTYGFTISNADDDLPIIGILDSGISDQTPLASILIEDDEFDLTGTSPYVDNLNHGTAVGAFAAIGKRFITDFKANLEADANLLSMKIIDSDGATISEDKVIKLIRDAYESYNIRLFVLTTGYKDNKKENSSISKYAYALDKLSYELDILIFISVGNLDITHIYENNGAGKNVVPYPEHLLNERTTLCIPAESYNNISVGAIAENFEQFDRFINITPFREFPSYYSRRFHLNKNHTFFNNYNNNVHLTKPDLIYAGGDYNILIDDISTAGITILSNNPAIAYTKSVGTSFSTPLIANLAAKIIKNYPELKSQSVKALLINNSDIPKFGDLFKSREIRSEIVSGKGIPDSYYSIFSDENNISMILEDSILPKRIKSYPIHLPAYLLEVGREQSLLEFSLTLCFSFDPELNNQLTYCPLNISFGVFKNLPLQSESEFSLNGSKAELLLLKQDVRWSEYYYWKNKLLSNTQKISFTIPKRIIRREDNTFKLAIKCQLHKLLPPYIEDKYDTNHNYSLAISIKENSCKGKYSNMLYNEMIAINNLEVINELEAEIELEN